MNPVEYLTVEDVLMLAGAVMGHPVEVRDMGLLDSAVHRPRATAFGQDAYPDLLSKAAALLHSLVLNHPFIDGNKRVALVATATLCELNGVALVRDQDAAYDLIMSVALGELSDVADIAGALGRLRAP